MIGFIGTGNMSTAIISGLLNSEYIQPKQIYGSAKSENTIKKIKEIYNINICSNIEVAKNSKVIFLGVKPYLYSSVLEEIKNHIGDDTIVVSIAPLQTIQTIRNTIGSEKKVVSSMPNTPATVGEGMSAVSFSENINIEEKQLILEIFSTFGQVEEIDEKLMNTVVAVSGSAPAYVYMFIESLADGAVRGGMTRQQAYKFASQTVLGSAKMVLDTKEHPALLKDKVCSPGGTTIQAVATLEKYGMRNAVLQAMQSIDDKLSK